MCSGQARSDAVGLGRARNTELCSGHGAVRRGLFGSGGVGCGTVRFEAARQGRDGIINKARHGWAW